jgi:hypothetical protein
MKSLLCIVTFLFFSIGLSQPQLKLQFKDDFRSFSNGSDGSPTWYPVKGSWQMIDGTYHQQSSDYDCASLTDQYIDRSFELSTTFKHLEGDLGAGLIFSSYRKDKTDFAQMVRYDGGTTFLMGYYQNGEFNGVASTKTDSLDLTKEHVLSVTVDRNAQSFTARIDGKIIQKDIPLQYRSGYFGLQSSAGKVRFSRISLRTLPMKSQPSGLDWIKHFIVTPSNSILAPNEREGVIQILDMNGVLLKNIGVPATRKGPLHHPSSISLLGDSRIVVTDVGANLVQIFAADGTWLNSAGGKGTDRGKFNEPVSVAVNSAKQIFVVDKGNNRIQVMDDSLRTVAVFGSTQLREPMDIAIEDSLMYVLNSGISQVDIFSWNGKKATWKKFVSYGGGEGRGLAVHHGSIFLSAVNEVRKYDTTGVLLHSFTGRSINFVLPWGINVAENGMVYFADFSAGRIIGTNEDLLDPTPVVRFQNPATALIEWSGSFDAPASVELLDGSKTRKITEIAPSKHHLLKIDNLTPLTNHHYKFTPAITLIPPAKQLSRNYSFITPAGKGIKEYVRLPMLAILFQNVRDEKNSKPGLPPQPTLPDSEIARIKLQLQDGARFYWIKSGMTFFVDIDYLVISETIDRSKLYGNEWWYPPRDSAINSVLKEHGRDIKNYSALLYLTFTQTWDSTLHKYTLAGKGGAFTNGVGTGNGYGISWWDVTKRNHNAGNNWLMVHEFNHQVDDIFMVSGYPEYWFNHISPTIGTAAKFGEHFDANAFIIGMVPREEWFDLQYTKLATTRDGDEDGIPDNDPSLPLDEARLGSDSTKADTDGDGVPDFNELSFSNWLTEGWGETFGSPVFPNLRDKDSDGDGLGDGEDPLPCSKIATEIPLGTPKSLGTLSDSKINAAVSAYWNPDSLYFVYEMNHPAPVKLMLDANTDGWFTGRDNYLITCTPDSSGQLKNKVQIFNGTDPHQWPFMDARLSEQIHLSTSLNLNNNKYYLRISIPANDSLCLNLIVNKRIGILTGFQVPFDDDGTKRYLDLFEPNRFFEVRLAR